jgi:hypothetical protein
MFARQRAQSRCTARADDENLRRVLVESRGLAVGRGLVISAFDKEFGLLICQADMYPIAKEDIEEKAGNSLK